MIMYSPVYTLLKLNVGIKVLLLSRNYQGSPSKDQYAKYFWFYSKTFSSKKRKIIIGTVLLEGTTL